MKSERETGARSFNLDFVAQDKETGSTFKGESMSELHFKICKFLSTGWPLWIVPSLLSPFQLVGE